MLAILVDLKCDEMRVFSLIFSNLDQSLKIILILKLKTKKNKAFLNKHAE